MSAWGEIGSCTWSRDGLPGITEGWTHEEVVISCARHNCVEGGMWMEEEVREGASEGRPRRQQERRCVASDAADRHRVSQERLRVWIVRAIDWMCGMRLVFVLKRCLCCRFVRLNDRPFEASVV